jgi:O-antigen/teichoic acid export membrane protein
MATWIKLRFQDRLVHQTSLLLAMRVLGTGLGFLFWVLAARIASAEHVGVASGAISAAALLAGLAQLGLGYVLIRQLAHSLDPARLVNRTILLVGSVALLEAGLFLLGSAVWSPALLPLRSTLVQSGLFILLVGSTALSQLLHWVFLARRQLTYSLIKQVCQSVLALGLLWLLQPLGGYRAVLLAYTGATTLTLILAWMCFIPRALPGYRLAWPGASGIDRALLRDALPNYAADQLQRAPDTILPLLALHYLGPAGGATFFIVWSLGSSISSWAGSIAESLLIEGMHHQDLLEQYARRATRIGLLLTIGIGVSLSLASQPILAIYGAAYAESGRYLLFAVAASGIPWVLISLCVSRLRIMHRHRAVFVLMAASNGLGIIVCGGLMSYGIIWAGLGWLAVQTGIWCGAHFFMQRQSNDHLR